MRYLLTIALLLGLMSAEAQIGGFPTHQGVPDHTPMMNSTWEAIDKMMYRVTTEGNKKVYTAHYPPELKKLEHKIVELPGYLVPLTSGRNHSTFMLSDRKSTCLNSSHVKISYAVFCLKKKKKKNNTT